jgi:hypothetical protein
MSITVAGFVKNGVIVATRCCPRAPSWKSASLEDRSKFPRSYRNNSTPGIGPARKPWNWSSGWRAKVRTNKVPVGSILPPSND